jgi:propanol-preferring alcohol dehydrogenase
LHRIGESLRAEERPVPTPGPGQVLLRVAACAVCRTDLHLIAGELPQAELPVIPGHEIIGRVVAVGSGVQGIAVGERIGVPWLGQTCGHCDYCRSGRENLCAEARFTGCQIDGGFAEYTVADARYCLPIPAAYSDVAAAPLMCAGLIGYRTLRMAGEGRRLGFYGFGAAAHIAAQVARWQGREVYAFTRPGDAAAQEFAHELGAVWAGGSDETPPTALDAALIFAPVGALVPAALRAVAPGGRVVCGGIHMSEIPAFPYALLWMEREIRSVANLTRSDGDAFLAIAGRIPVRTVTTSFPLREANAALQSLRDGTLTGAAVLVPDAAAGTAAPG